MQTHYPPWLETIRQPKFLAGAAGLLLALVLALVWVVWRWGMAEDRHAMLQEQAAQGFLQAPSSTRNLRLDPRGAARSASIDGGGFPQRLDIYLAARTDLYDRFRVSLLRADGILLLHADRLTRDSNNDLRLSVNSSVLPNGQYLLRIDGYPRRGEPERFAEARLTVTGR